MSSRVNIVIRPMEEWHEKVRDLTVTSTNELMPMIYRMFDLLRSVKESYSNKEALRFAIRELKYEQAKSYSRDNNRNDELHDIFYGLSQCLIEVYSTDRELTTVPQTTATVSQSMNSNGSGYPMNEVKTEEESATVTCLPTYFSSVRDQLESDESSLNRTMMGQNNLIDCMRSSFESHPDQEAINVGASTSSYHSEHSDPDEYDSKSISVPIDNDMNNEEMEESDNDEAQSTQAYEIDRDELVECNLNCPVCSRQYNNPHSLKEHLRIFHKTSVHKLEGRFVCSCGHVSASTKSCGVHFSLCKFSKSSLRTFYNRMKLQQAIDESNQRGIQVGAKETPKRCLVDPTRKTKLVDASKCFVCQERLSKGQFVLESHLYQRHLTTPGKQQIWYECVKCRMVAYSSVSVRRHFKKCNHPDQIVLREYDDESGDSKE